MFFYRAGSQEILYTYTHTLNRYKNPDTLVLDPTIKYDLMVSTLPQIKKTNIEIKEHTHNTIEVDAAQGYLKFIPMHMPMAPGLSTITRIIST